MFRFIQSEKRLSTAEKTLERLDKTVRDLQLDWEEMYDKFRRLYARISKRVEREEALRETEGETQPDATPEPSAIQGNGSHPGFLTPNQKKIQQQILRRRSGQ